MYRLSNNSLIDTTRKNHALEHATMTILAERYKGVRMLGHSKPGWFCSDG